MQVAGGTDRQVGSEEARRTQVEVLLRDLTPVVMGALVRRYGDFDLCEDAVQEALLAAALSWPGDGVPANPRGWLITVAARRRIELWRQDAARTRRELNAAAMDVTEPPPSGGTDDGLTLLFLCCHPALTPASQMALTLRAVGGLTTAEIARALLVPEPTVAQRISRAKARIKGADAPFALPETAEVPSRTATVRDVLYLIFNEGYTSSSGPTLTRVDLSNEAVRLARQLHDRMPEDGETAGLLALMLLTDARRPARTRPDGALVPLDRQDRTLWNHDLIQESNALLVHALSTTAIGPYQLQAAIAAVHDDADRAEDTEWRQILALYDLLDRIAPGPAVTLNRVVALAMVSGPRAGLEELAAAASHPALTDHHRVDAVRAHLLDLSGDRTAARDAYQRAALRTLSLPEQRYLRDRAGQLAQRG